MTKPATSQDLSNEIDRDIVWRIREISSLKLAIRSAEAGDKDALLRALIAMMYAHWEGFVRNSAVKYFQHITMRRLKYSSLQEQFYINSFLVRLDALFRSKESVSGKCDLISDIISLQDEKFTRINPALIDTKSNLNSDVLRDLCRICGFEFSGFEDSRDFLDIILLKRRNAVAHGQTVDLIAGDMDEIVSRTIALMQHFKSLVENKIYQTNYLKA